jgi:deoxyadenosine/deoxycytidine kinase
MSPDHPPGGFHLSIVGNVGTGKSTLAKLIQARTGCMLYLEDPGDYLFLRLFFESPHDWGFANQLHFVITKFAQQAQIRRQNQCAVQEMSAFATHFIWTPASHEIEHISPAGVAALDKVYEQMAMTPVSMPDITIILQASVETVKHRIRRRGRDYEALDPRFVRLIEIVDKYTNLFGREVSGGLMMVDTETLDFTRPSTARDALLDEILTRVSYLPS